MMDIHVQAEILEKRGEFCMAEHLRKVASEESARLEKIEIARRNAFKVVLCDNDY
jgi:hypothetical protein